MMKKIIYITMISGNKHEEYVTDEQIETLKLCSPNDNYFLDIGNGNYAINKIETWWVREKEIMPPQRPKPSPPREGY